MEELTFLINLSYKIVSSQEVSFMYVQSIPNYCKRFMIGTKHSILKIYAES